MRTRTLAFFLVMIWLFVTVYVPASVLWHPFSLANREGELYSSFESSTEGWRGEGVSTVSLPSRIGGGSLKFEWKNGMDLSVYAPNLTDDESLAAVVVELYLESGEPSATTGPIKPILFFKNKDGNWYQAFGLPLVPNEWNTFRIDVSATSVELQPVHQGGTWDGQARRECDIWGISFASSDLESAVIYIDNVRLVHDRHPYWAKVFGVEPGPKTLGTFELYEASFDILPFPTNPFDPSVADVWCAFVCPDGVERKTPAFFYRPYRRVIRGAEEQVLPDGSCCWKVRYTPTIPGNYKMYIFGEVMGRRLKFGPVEFTVVPKKHRGFVSVSAKSPDYFVFADGTQFYPIGHNFRSPNDPRTAKLLKIPTPPDRGTFRYEEIIPKMAKAGENSFEVWMASWFAEIEWVHRWKNYYGLGDYNLANAWKLDKVIDLATLNNLLVHLVIDNHGQYSSVVDAEWQHSPYNILNGGFLGKPDEFWGSNKANESHKNKLRYILARWGYSPTIFGFELVSELDLTGGNLHVKSHMTRDVYHWHKMMAEYIGKTDLNNHLVTTHYSGTYEKIDAVMVREKYINYIVGDAYRDGKDIVSLMNESAARVGWGKYGKPYFITEYGGSPWGDNLPGLHADLHCGIWSTYMTSMAGTPYFWWFDLIDREDWYFHFRALANFHKGESRIGKNLRSRWLVTKGGTSSTSALALYDSDGGYAYVFERNLAKNIHKLPPEVIKDATLPISLLDDVTYSYEIWDTWKGIILYKGEVKSVKRSITIPLGDIPGDAAIKFRKVR